MKLKSPYQVKPHEKLRLAARSTREHDGLNETTAGAVFVQHRAQLADLQEKLYAAQSDAVLIVLQGMDTAGKDGTISHIFSGVNPQGCDVASFKVPTPIEARHDFLWRCHVQVPGKGMIGIFNRSHYEDVLSPWVHGHLTDKQRRQRLEEINAWEEMLAANRVTILKFFLHISHAEQTQRLQERIDDPEKHWKLSPSDFEERAFWPKYQDAYETLLRHTSRKHAPWFVIPADHKWYRNLAISKILVEALGSLKLEFPKPTFDPSGILLGTESPRAAALQVKARAAAAALKPE